MSNRVGTQAADGAGARWAGAVRREAGAVGRAARAARDGPGRERDLVVQALKAALSAVLAWFVASDWLGDPMALMAPWVALVLVQATVYGSLRQAAQQWTAICAGTLLASAAQALTGNTLGALALSVPLLMLLAQWPRFGDQGVYAATTAVFTLASGAVSVPAVGHRVGQAALGAVIGVAVNALVLPPVHLRDVRENLGALAREAAEVLHAVAAGLRDGEWDAATAGDWSRGAARLERRREGLRSARGWSRESLRLTTGPLRALHRVPLDVPPESEDARWGRVTDHVTALTRTLAVAADDTRAPAPPEAAALRVYARLLDLIGDACEAEAERFRGAGAVGYPDAEAETETEELRTRLQGSLRVHAGQGAARTAVLGTLLLQAENLWVEAVPGTRQRERAE
ncbi:FUSC family protein [Streptomyces aurantiogriseus]|uniref:FUSC family protein n=1 Tax=Streptomyces aurantiogriseus TaxID=66870 RepID=A0A918CPX7_9ACTN|nr:aromatic acid exporter family protein [Streptomyces aurantiogriseus]GGR32660.1 FUSC family protein [Streptomyces aurantiogriseus]